MKNRDLYRMCMVLIGISILLAASSLNAEDVIIGEEFFLQGQGISVSQVTKPHILSNGPGDVLISWSLYFNPAYGYGFGQPGYRVLGRTSLDFGTSVADAKTISSISPDQYDGIQICRDDNGNVYVKYEQNSNGNVYVERSHDSGVIWSGGRKITGSATSFLDGSLSKICCNNVGGVYVVYNTSSQMYLCYSLDYGNTWASVQLSEDHDIYDVSCDDHGHVYLAYRGLRNDSPASFFRTVSIGNMIEDAEDGDTIGWWVSDNKPAGAAIENFYDEAKESRVIKLIAPGDQDNGFKYVWGAEDHDNKSVQWDMKNYAGGGDYIVLIRTRTSTGEYLYLCYSNNYRGLEQSSKKPGYTVIYHKLSSRTANGYWHTIKRDLRKDLQDVTSIPGFEDFANVEIDFVDGVYVRGSYMFDNILLTP